MPLPRAAPDGPLPLSFFQERLWVLHRLEPESTVYNLVTAWPSPGPADPARVADALRALVTRHEGLRATFREEGGVPSIVLAPPEAVPVEVRDLRDRDEAAQTAELRSAMLAFTRAPFDLARSPPARFTVFRVAGERVVTVLSAHHIAVDAWSMRLLGQEIAAAHASAAAPPPPALQYADYAAWQRATFDREVVPHVAFWERHLAGAPPVSTLPADLPGPADERGGGHAFRIDRALADGVRALVREEGGTVYMALLAAFAAVLRWHTSQDEVVVGTALGVRERPELEKVVGPFVNVLPLRLDLSDDPSFAQLLARARTALLDAYEHRGVPFETIVERLKPVRNLDRAPIFQTAVVLHNVPDDAGATPIASGGSIFDLSWFVREDRGDLAGLLEYRASLYSPELVARLAARLEALLAAAVADRNRPLSRVSLLSAEERAAVVEGFNATVRPTDPATFVAQLERQAAATPEAIAVGFEGATLTYRALDARANQLAHHLRRAGVARGAVVGLCLPRSLDLVPALAAVQKAGGAYLPLDPDFPAERLGYMLADSGARAVVTRGALPAGLAVPAGVAVLDLSAAEREIAALPREAPAEPVRPSDLAYLMYTSGSTGRPKGVRVGQAALSNFLASMRVEPGISAQDVVAAVTTLSFDIAGLELYLPLVAGARVEVLPKATAASGPALGRALAQVGATILQATPATFRLLLEAGWRGPPGFRVLCGGEPMPRDLADALVDRVSELWNMYGPTETTIWSTLERVRPGKGPVLIGRPIANTTVDVMGKGGQPLPPGVPGEIWIGGAGVAEGYHGRPDLTAERFLADPLRPGGRVYRTGDLGRWTADGRLEHLGRLDHQVKVRGFRIELGEIESVLASHPSVKQAVVLAREAAPGDWRLVAYVVWRPGEDLTVSEVRKHLRKTLPEYMVPALVVALDALPLTPNGKLDRARLPDPLAGAGRAAAAAVPPAPGTEQVLAGIWREILRVEAVGAEDNFFELGGHSLLSLRVAAAVEQRLGWRMDPRMLFFQNLRQLAAAADAARAGAKA